jgi:hypothetical protein
VNVRHAPHAVALAGLACAITATLYRGQGTAVVFLVAAAVAWIAAAILTGIPRPDPGAVPSCAMCRRRAASEEHDGACSRSCAEDYRTAMDRQHDEDQWWRAIA